MKSRIMKKMHPLLTLGIVGAWIMTSSSGVGAQNTLDPDGTITMRDTGSPFIALNIWVKAGSQNDPEGKEGLAALTGSLLSNGGTESKSAEEILEALYPMATTYGSNVDKEMTVFRGVVHRDNLEAFYEIFREAMLKPGFAEEDFSRVKSRTLNFLEQGRLYNRDEELSKELLFAMAYRGTPYEHPVEGYVESVQSLTLDDVRDFYERFYVSNNIVVGIGGGYPEGFVEGVRQDFDSRPQRSVPVVERPEPEMPDGTEVLIVEKQTDATAISFGFPIDLVRGDDDFIAMKLVNSWFGEHRHPFSHLLQVIRVRRGMNYGSFSYIEAFPRGYATQERPVNYSRRSQLFEVWIRPVPLTSPDDLHDRALFATRAALRELKALVDHGLPESEIERTRNFLSQFSVTYGSTSLRRLSFAIDDAFYDLPEPGYLRMIRPGLNALDKTKVDTAIHKHLRSDNMWMVFVTQDAEGLKAKLLSGEETLIGYAGEKDEAHLAEDREIGNFSIRVREENIRILQIDEVFQSGR